MKRQQMMCIPIVITLMLSCGCSSASDDLARLQMSEMCAAAAQRIWKEDGYDERTNGYWSYTTHYNRRLRRCLIHKSQGSMDLKTLTSTIDDVFERVQVAGATNSGGKETIVDFLGHQENPSQKWFDRLMSD